MMHGLGDGGSTAKRSIARWKANGRRNGDGKKRAHEICQSSSCIGGTEVSWVWTQSPVSCIRLSVQRTWVRNMNWRRWLDTATPLAFVIRYFCSCSCCSLSLAGSWLFCNCMKMIIPVNSVISPNGTLFGSRLFQIISINKWQWPRTDSSRFQYASWTRTMAVLFYGSWTLGLDDLTDFLIGRAMQMTKHMEVSSSNGKCSVTCEATGTEAKVPSGRDSRSPRRS